MTGGLPEALKSLLTASLPGLFGNTTNTVGLTVGGGLLEIDRQQSADATAGEPRPEDRVETLGFDPSSPAGPYTLGQPPYPGPRRVWLVARGGRVPLRQTEVRWDRADARNFSLALRPQRDVSTVTGVRVLYGVAAIFTTVKAVQTLELQLETSDADLMDRTEALVIGVIQLNRQHLIDEARASYSGGDYGAKVELKELGLLGGSRSAVDTRVLTLRADIELRANRALGEEDGAVIEHIRTPGRPVDPDRPVDVYIDVEA
jgi:hypothetical protein